MKSENMTLSELKSKTIREQMEYIFDGIEATYSPKVFGTPEFISEYGDTLLSLKEFNIKEGNNEDFREARIKHMVEFHSNRKGV
jgi:hypothetical protein